MANTGKDNKPIKAGIGYTIGNYLLSGLPFFTLPIFTRLLGTEDYGVYNTFMAYESIFYIILGFAIHSSYKNARYRYGIIGVDEGAGRGSDFNSYVSSSLLLVIISMACWLILANGLGFFFERVLDIDIVQINLLVVFSCAMAVIVCFNAYVGILYEYRSFLLVAGLNAVSSIALSILLMLTICDGVRAQGRILGTIIPAVVIGASICIYFWRKARPSVNRDFWIWGLKYSLPIIPHGISQVILSQFDRIMIGRMVSQSKAGIYSFAYNIFFIVNVTATSLDSVWGPWFYERMHAGDRDRIRRYASLYMILMLIFAIMLMLVSPEIIRFAAPGTYGEAVYCVMPLIAGGYFAWMYTLPAAIEYYYEKTRYIMVGTMCAAVINIVLNYVCILKYGYIAAAYTTLATYILYFVFHYCLAWKIEKRCMFDNRAVTLVALLVIVSNFIVIRFLDYSVLRWGVAVLIGIVSLIAEEHHYHLIRRAMGR